MFDIKQLPGTPAWARRLQAFQQVTRLDLDASVVELAQQGTISATALAEAGFQLDAPALAAIQYAVDWNCRCVLMDTNDLDARRAALAALWCTPQQHTVILTHPKHYAMWARAIRQLWPTHSISVYGNSRYTSLDDGVGYPEGIHYGSTPDVTAQWQITSYGSFIYHDVMSRNIPDQMVVDELMNKNSVNYRWAESLQGLFLECPRVLMLQNINSFANDSSDSLTSLLTPGTDGYGHLMWLIQKAILPGSVAAEWLSGMNATEGASSIQYLHNHGYPSVDLLSVVHLMGVSTHLLAVDPYQSLRFHDDSIAKAVTNGHANASMRKYVDHSNSVQTRASASLDELAAQLVDDGAPVEHFVRDLKNSTWAAVKSSLVSRVHGQLTSRRIHIAIVAHDDALVRNILMKTGVELYGAKDTGLTTARYLHPQECWRNYWSGEIPPPISTLVYRNIADINVDVLEHTDYLVLAEWPQDRDSMTMIQELARATNTRLVHTTLNGTFEHSLESILLANTA